MGGRYLKHQTQPCPTSCVSTSLAIIVDKPCADLVEMFHAKYHDGMLSLREMLNTLGVPFKSYDSCDHCYVDEPGAYLAKVPSLNITGGNHQVVFEMTEDDEFYVIDPVQGRDGRRYYVASGQVSNDLEHDLCGFILDAFIPLSWLKERK